MGKKVDHQSQAEHTEGQLEQSHHQGKKNRIGDVAFAARCGQRFKRGGGHQRNNRHRSRGQLAAGAEQRGDDRRKKGGIQPKIGGHASQLCIGHGLGDKHQGYRQPGYGIGFEQR